MKKYKTHYFIPLKTNGSLCGVSPSWENWCRKNYCTENTKKVNCKNCLKILNKNA